MFKSVLIVALVAVCSGDPIRLTKDIPIDRPIFPNGRIIGGEYTNIEKHPHQISLQRSGKHSCGGSIISKYYVLTAGHCVDGASPSRLTVRSGSTYHNHGGQVHQVVKIIQHERYGVTVYGIPKNDIALVKVSQPFEFDESRQPAQLFDFKEECKAGFMSQVTGWGKNGGWSLPDKLMKVSIPIINRDLCSRAYGEVGGLPKGQICASFYGEGGKDACQGDSGGPLTVKGRLAGIVSWGNGCAQPEYPGAYTEVAHYRNWINAHAEF